MVHRLLELPTDAKPLISATSGHEAAAGPGVSKVSLSDMVSLEVVGGHRLYDLYPNLFLAFAVAKDSGLCLAPLLTGGVPGTFVVPAFNDHSFTAVPLEAFADVSSPRQLPCRSTALPPGAPRFEMRAFNTSCSANISSSGRPTAQDRRVPAQPRAQWCRQRASGSLISVDVCVSVCSADGNSYRPVGDAIREAAELIAARGSTSAGNQLRASLVLRLGRAHERSIAGVTHYGRLHRGQIPFRLSKPMAALGGSYVRSLGCGATHGRTVGATLRIMYDGGKRHTPTLFKEACKSSFKALGRWVAQRAPPGALPDGGCLRRGYLATDWAAMADSWKSSSHRSAIEQCWQEASVEEAATATSPLAWAWPPDPRELFALAARAAPALLLRHGHDGKGPRAFDVKSFRDFFELAVLAQVDECYALGHFGSIANQARSQFNRSACNK